MLDRLVESKNHSKENRKLNGLFGGALSLAAIGLVFAFVISLYSFELSLGSGDLELSSLAPPVMIEETQPEPPKEMQKQQQTEPVKADVPTRVANIQRLDESPVKSPDNVSVTPSKNQARPKTPFKIGNIDITPINPNAAIGDRNREGTKDGTGISNNTTSLIEKDKEDAPVIKPPVKTEEPKKDKPPVVVSGGVVNGKAKYLAQPNYPAAAKQVRAQGRVEVQVMIDESGRVVSASVVNGHPLLRDSALSAARNSTFAPTKLSNVPVKVSGIIVYNFNL